MFHSILYIRQEFITNQLTIDLVNYFYNGLVKFEHMCLFLFRKPPQNKGEITLVNV